MNAYFIIYAFLNQLFSVTFIFYPKGLQQLISEAGVFLPIYFPFKMACSKEPMKMNGRNILEQSENEFLWADITFTRHSVHFLKVHFVYLTRFMCLSKVYLPSWECQKCVPLLLAIKSYRNVSLSSIEHWVTMGTPSIYWDPF